MTEGDQACVYDLAARSGPSCAVWSGGVPQGAARGGSGRASGGKWEGGTAATGRPDPPRAAALQAPGLALRQDQDRSVPRCLKRSRAALLRAGRARPAPLRARASRRAPSGRAPEPWPERCERSGQRRINPDRLAPAPATASARPRPVGAHASRQRCRSSSRRLASAPLGNGTVRF